MKIRTFNSPPKDLNGSATKYSAMDVLRHYSLGKILSRKRIKRGIENENFYVHTTKGRYVLRKYAHSDATRKYIAFELQALESIKDLQVPHIIPTKSGKWIVEEGGFYVLFSYIPGEHIRKFNPSHLHQLGSFLGKLHAQTKHYPSSSIRKIISLSTTKQRLKKYPACRKYLPVASSLKLPILPKSLIHADIHDEAVIFSNGKLTGVVDWDDCHVNACVIDLFLVMEWWCLEKGKLDFQLWRSFLKGYEMERKLSSNEKRYFIQYGRLVLLWYISYLHQKQYRSLPMAKLALKIHEDTLDFIEKPIQLFDL
jgi:homoserine kinase type II